MTEVAPPGTVRVTVQPAILGSGTVYWDDVSLMREDTVALSISDR